MLSRRWDLASVELCRDRAERARARGSYGCDGRNELPADLARFLFTHLTRCNSNLCEPFSRDAPTAKLRSPHFCGGEGCFGPLRDGLGLLLSDSGQDVDNEPIRLAYRQPRIRRQIP